VGAVIVSLENAFHRLLQRWQSIAAAQRVQSGCVGNWMAYVRKHGWVATVATALLSAAFGAYCMYRFVGSDVPALRAEFQRIAGEVTAFAPDLNALEARQGTALRTHLAQEQIAREAMASSLRALTIQAIVLTQKLERRALRPQEAKNLLASIREISIAESPALASVSTVGGVLPEDYMPMLASAKKEEDLKEAAGFFNASTPSVRPAYLGRLLLTRQGTWRAGDREILFKWDGGSATFRAMNDLPQSEIARKVELFNSVSQSVSQVNPDSTRGDIAPRRDSLWQASAAPRLAQVSRPAHAPAAAAPVPRLHDASIASRRTYVPPRMENFSRPETRPRMGPALAP